ncbi:carbohydrate-binding module family 18 [Trichoderma arundinaceum]|uniref:Carbohydrate-binding module family 18 n=1 Tax=Trichoderma arundinaceum TaxID=490622 RepID=A0A395P0X5_TRIAR|nr:carbohydrate-binding module family 18 [Trichoderma arundinaceum]
MQTTLLFLWIATLSSAELFVNYDQKLEDRPRLYTVVKEDVGRLEIPSKSSSKNDNGKVSLGAQLKPREALDILLGKRQSCPQGYGYCPTSAVRMDTVTLKDPSVAQLVPVIVAKLVAAPAIACRYYWYYYWTYSIDIQASIVTSTRSTTWTTFSVKTTDAGAASEYFSSKSKTLSLPTPAAATSLESLAGSTSFVSRSSDRPSPSPSPSPTESSVTEAPSPTFNPVPSSPDDNDSSTTSRTSSSATTSLLHNGGDSPPSSGGGNGGGNGGDDSSGAKPLWTGSDWKNVWILVLGAGTGVLAVIL